MHDYITYAYALEVCTRYLWKVRADVRGRPQCKPRVLTRGRQDSLTLELLQDRCRT